MNIITTRNNHKISIITVTYNAEEFLEQTIKSVIEQDYPNIEYIIIDGASTDGTINIIKEYEKYISYWISEPDNGIYDAMNKGTDLSTGDWILFLNAGDTFYVKEVIKNFLQDVNSDTELYNGAINFIDCSTNQEIKKTPFGLEKIWEMIPCWHQASFIKTSLMKKYKYSLEYKIAGDHDFYLKCFVNNNTFQFTNNIIANMLAGGLHMQQSQLAHIESTFILAKYAPDISLVYESLNCKLFFSQYEKIDMLKLSSLYSKLFAEIEKIKVKYNRLTIYGYGSMGKTLEKLLENKVDLIIDQNEKNSHSDISIIKLDEIKNFHIEKILISVLGREKEISEALIKLGIDESKILMLDINES